MTASGREMREPCCDEVIAGEYVLGVLPAETARQVEGRLKTDRQFAAMFALLDEYGSYEAGFVDYSTVTQAERNELGAQLNALSEPLSHLTNVVLGLS